VWRARIDPYRSDGGYGPIIGISGVCQQQVALTAESLADGRGAAYPLWSYQFAIDLDHFSAVLTTCSTKVQQP
jgi:hypothetical protein